MAKVKSHTMNGVMPDDARDMIKEIKFMARTARKEIGLYLAIKFITSSKEKKREFGRYAAKHQKVADRVRNVLDKHERGKSK